MITIKEMADIIGVSPTTVSNVIHGKTKEVSKETVEKVNELLEKYHYIPNMNARNLAKKYSKIVGVVFKYNKSTDNNFVQDPFAGEILGAIEKQVRKHEYYTMIYLSEDLDDILRFVSTWNVDGLIAVGFWPDECHLMKKSITKPMVFVDCYFNEDGFDYVNVGLKDKEGGYELTRYLIQCGHKNIAFITDCMISVYKARYEGHKEALEEAGIPVSEQNLLYLRPNQKEFETSIENVFKRYREFSAMFCVSDYYAAKIMNYFIDRGVKLPDDISIVGFDDNLIGQSVRPGLTTMRQNPSQKGYLAVEQLIKLIDQMEIEETNIQMTAQLIIRNTVKVLNP
ncbi:LacI family DNA-binding transcriptional regulator [Anaerocolumna aminovalerica]|jgi:LacI family transcriptional regulator|uniref:Transcriptional regulator, LacI family n=1 Tax=Anaerocolumna aminovalerica TaxID=1527 RepID=A0A1I5IHT8_9FIRM|nr:LacI family DNA-binding transcriptional regulator [Anaerocolumna aminovalerica]MBU5333839.1 LacI family transcriptional regulator [Anaerocolumna aminovalerica]SFO60115.1 transcriptional regulator, LacI family [Anaerocolumna aminovalerica]